MHEIEEEGGVIKLASCGEDYRCAPEPREDDAVEVAGVAEGCLLAGGAEVFGDGLVVV